MIVDGQVDHLRKTEIIRLGKGFVLHDADEIVLAHLGQLVRAVDDIVLRGRPLVAELLDHVPRQRENGVVLQQAGQVGHRILELDLERVVVDRTNAHLLLRNLSFLRRAAILDAVLDGRIGDLGLVRVEQALE